MTPVDGSFDVERIKAYLDCQPDIIQDPIVSGTHLLCGEPDAVATYYRLRLAAPERFPHIAVIRIAAARVQLDQVYASNEQLRTAMDFMRWLRSNFDWTITDEYDQDITDKVERLGVESLYPDHIVTSDLPWSKTLIELGFNDLEPGNPNWFGLMDFAPIQYDDLDKVVTYLHSGHIIRRTATIVYDDFDDGPDVVKLGTLHFLSDDMFVWRSDLAHFIAKYHVGVMPAFLCHIRSNNYQVPADSECTREFSSSEIGQS